MNLTKIFTSLDAAIANTFNTGVKARRQSDRLHQMISTWLNKTPTEKLVGVQIAIASTYTKALIHAQEQLHPERFRQPIGFQVLCNGKAHRKFDDRDAADRFIEKASKALPSSKFEVVPILPNE